MLMSNVSVFRDFCFDPARPVPWSQDVVDALYPLKASTVLTSWGGPECDPYQIRREAIRILHEKNIRERVFSKKELGQLEKL